MRVTMLYPSMVLFVLACSKDPPPQQYPQQQYPGQYQQQQYPQQQYPQQQYPQQQYPQQQYPQQQTPPPSQTAPAPAAAGSGTPTAIPGVLKYANGTCSITPPSLNGQPAAPIVGPCPPGI